MAIGIIAEYNPFHAGHAYQISEIKKICAEEIIAVMSGSFTQRGSPAILDKWTRARLAILGGVDLVFELPFISAVRSAQDFARGGIKLLESLGVVDKLAFGAELDELEKLKSAAAAFNEKFFTEKLHKDMSQGISYAAAVTKILSEVVGLDEKFLRQPNTILAIEYLRALPEKISPLLIKRVGAAYDDLTLRENFSSASAIRAALYEESPDWEKISAQVDDETLNALRAEKISGLVDENFLFRPILAKLLTARADDLKKIYGMTEGLEFRLLNAATAKNFSELVGNLIGRRYTASRIRRLLLHFLLDVTAEQISELDAATCARVLAFNERGRALLKKISTPIITKVTKHLNRRDLFERRRELAPYQKILLLDVLATNLRGLLFNERKTQSDFSMSPIFIKS
ncbi:MAG: nucleotidyltransferase family protein [Selenomonadaceae bacterium]|nr:nucleotidyltransferase family protein [Selenomonadaceae bacterium]